MWIREVLYLTFGGIFSASEMSPQWTEESTPQIGFALLINGRLCKGTDAVVAIVDRVSLCKSVRVFVLYACVHVCVCACECLCDKAVSSENQQKPVISHVNAGLKANMRINWGTYNNNTWKMEQSLFLQSSQPRRGCLSLWEDVWLPPLYVCFGPLSWFSYTSTLSSKHVKIFHAH